MRLHVEWSWGVGGLGVALSLIVSIGCSESRELPADGGDTSPETGPADAASDAPGDGATDAVADADVDTGIAGSCVAVGEHPVRRLRLDHYRGIYRRLTGVEPILPPRPGEERLGSADVPYTVLELEALRNAAQAAGPLVADRFCAGEAGCYRDAVAIVLNETIRRQPALEEVRVYWGLFDWTAAEIGDGGRGGFERVVAAALMSPWFLFVVELGGTDIPTATEWALRPSERMSRLMLAFTHDGLVWGWDMPPVPFDDAAVEAQLSVWLSGGFAGVPRFHERWLLTREAVASRDDFEASFEGETGAFVSHVYGSEPNVEALLASPYSFLDSNTAMAYGVPFSGPVRTRTDLDPASFASLITHGSWLAGRGIAARGVALRQALLCSDVPPPPPGTCVMLPPEPGETERATYERSLDDPACASCHSLFDGFGFALGDFDREGCFVGGADTSGFIAEIGAFAGAFELAQRAADAEPVRRCLAEQWAVYLMDQQLSAAGRDALRCELGPVIDDFVASGDLQALLARLAVHPALYRRAPRPMGTTFFETPWPPAVRSLATEGDDLRFAADTVMTILPYLAAEERPVLEQYVVTLRELESRVSP